jgi:hypothetical protein
MAGLLDYTQDPMTMGLLGAGAALLTPQRYGGGAGAALNAFPQAMVQAEQMRNRQRLTDAQVAGQQSENEYRKWMADERRRAVDAAEAKRQADQAQAEALAMARQEFESAYHQSGGQWSPTLTILASRAGVKGEDLERFAKGGNLGRSPLAWQNGLGMDPFSGQPRATAPDVNKPFIPSLVNGQVTSVPNVPVQSFELNKAATGATRVNTPVSVIAEREESKVVGGGMGKAFLEMQDSAMKARGKVNNLSRLETLLSGYETGKLTPLGKEIASYAASVGLNVDKNLGNKEAAEALSNELALQSRNPAGGAGMPGAMSDADREYLRNMVPGLAKTPTGNRQIIETQRRLAKREIDVAKLASEYRAKRGTLDPGFFDELQRWSESNPLFEDLRAVPTVSPDGRSVSGTIGKAGAQGWSIQRVPK